MPFTTALNIIDQIRPTHHVSFALFGESTLHPDLIEIIQYAKKRLNIKTILYSNFVKYIDLSDCGLDKLIVSMDATNEGEYLRTKGADSYQKVINNIKLLRTARNKIPEIVIQYADLMYKNKPRKFSADKLKLGRYITWGGEIGGGTQKRKPLPCGHIFNYLNIASNGDVVMCCLDYNHSVVLGNVNEDNVYDIWHGERFEKLRQDQRKGVFPYMCLNCENEYYVG